MLYPAELPAPEMILMCCEEVQTHEIGKILLLLRVFAKGAYLRLQAYTALHQERQAINCPSKRKRLASHIGQPFSDLDNIIQALQLDFFPRQHDNRRALFNLAPQLADVAIAHTVATTRGRLAD